jgi:preprotein translocase subunit SecG
VTASERIFAPAGKKDFMIFGFVTALHIIVCMFLIAVVLLQSGKSADIAAAFGGAGSQTAFGPRSAANALTKATTWAAIIFMLTSFTLAIVASRRSSSSGSVLGDQKSAPVSAPATPQQQKPGPEPQPITPAR